MEFKYHGKHKKSWKRNNHHDDRWERPNYELDTEMAVDRVDRRQDRRADPYMNQHQRHKNKKKNKRLEDSPDRWYRISVLFTQELEKTFIIRSITNLCGVPFAPVNFNQQESRCVFYVQGSQVAREIGKCNNRITKPDGRKLAINVDPVSSPPSAQLTVEQIGQLKVFMSENYDKYTRTLTLSGVFENRELKEKNLYFALDDNTTLQKVVDIIAEHIPELENLNLEKNNIYLLKELERVVIECPNLTSLNLSCNKIRKPHQLEPLRGLELKELTLENTALAVSYRQKWDQYVSILRDYFPTLNKLDGKELPPPIGFETGEQLPKFMPDFFPMDDVRALVVTFGMRFYTTFDVGDRQTLLPEYHPQAFFSLSIPRIPHRSHVPQDYHAENRNLQSNSDRVARTRLLRQGAANVVDTLTQLPETVHHSTTFVVDVTHVSATLMTFTINGLFNIMKKQNNADSQPKRPGQLLTFTRTLAVVPIPGNPDRFSIINDMLLISPATPAQGRALKKTTLAIAMKEQMVLQLSGHTKMNIPFSTKCLEQSDWNLELAIANFNKTNAEGLIPQAAFLV